MKRSTNKEARSSRETSAVVDQLRRYRERLELEGLRKEISDVYAGAIRTLSQVLQREDLPLPRTVFDSVPLLIVGPATAPSPGAKEVWQHKLLAAPPSLDAEIIGIDGREERMIIALDEFFCALDDKLAGAASQ